MRFDVITLFPELFAPHLTLEGIFGLKEPRAWPLVQELGFWNTSVGLLCMASLGQRQQKRR